LEKTGIFEGMSGSPVYIDGKLLGAVAYSFSFTKEPIGGITPITEMVAAFDEAIAPASGIKIVDNRNRKPFAPLSARRSLSAEGLAEVARARSLSSLDFGGRSLTPIATP
jgi:hypothetical protein